MLFPVVELQLLRAIRANDPNVDDLFNANRRLAGVGDIFMFESTGDFQLPCAPDLGQPPLLLIGWPSRLLTPGVMLLRMFPLDSASNGATDPFNYKLDHGDADLDRRQMFGGKRSVRLAIVQEVGRRGESNSGRLAT